MYKFITFVLLSLCMVLFANNSQAAKSEKETSLSLNEQCIMGLNFSLITLEQPNTSDNFFKRLFGSKKTKAERSSRSRRHPSSRPQKYTPPPSRSQNPDTYAGRTSGPSYSSNSQHISNNPKPPLHTSLRNQYHSTGLWEVGFSLGTAHTITDISANKGLSFGDFADYHTNNYSFKLGFFTRYIMNNWFALNMGMDYANLSGQAPFNEGLTENDPFSFSNDIFEFFAKTEFMLPMLSRSPFDIYGFAGIGVFFSDARVFNANDRLLENSVDYSQVQPVIPMGFGFSYRLPNSLRIGYEFGWRNTIFHYLDGVQMTQDNYDNYFFNNLKISFGF